MRASSAEIKNGGGCLAGIEKNGGGHLPGAWALTLTRPKTGGGHLITRGGRLPAIIRFLKVGPAKQCCQREVCKKLPHEIRKVCPWHVSSAVSALAIEIHK